MALFRHYFLFSYYFSTDFDWSIGNDFIVSASSDGSYRLWKSSSGKCLRIIADTSGSMANCSCFHSQNGNFLIVCDLLYHFWLYFSFVHIQLVCPLSSLVVYVHVWITHCPLSPLLPLPPLLPFSVFHSPSLFSSFLFSSSRLVIVRVSWRCSMCQLVKQLKEVTVKLPVLFYRWRWSLQGVWSGRVTARGQCSHF